MYISAEEVEPPEGVAVGSLHGFAYLFGAHASLDKRLRSLVEAGIAFHDALLVEWHSRYVHALWFQFAIKVCCFLVVYRHFLVGVQGGVEHEVGPEQLNIFLQDGIVQRDFLQILAFPVHGVREVIDDIHLAQSIVAVERSAHVVAQFNDVCQFGVVCL